MFRFFVLVLALLGFTTGCASKQDKRADAADRARVEAKKFERAERRQERRKARMQADKSDILKDVQEVEADGEENLKDEVQLLKKKAKRRVSE